MESVSFAQALAYAEEIGTQGLNLKGFLRANLGSERYSTADGGGLLLKLGDINLLHAKSTAFID